jgi:CBS domain-containing protein
MNDDNYGEDSFHEDPIRGERASAVLDSALGSVPRARLLTVAPDAPVIDVIREMNERSGGCALVVQHGALVGIFTERDVLRKVAASGMDTRMTPVSEVMTARPDTLPVDATVAYALNRMAVEGYRHIPLVDAGARPVGVVGMRDIIAWLVETFPAEALNVPPAPSSHPRTREGA